MRFTDEEYKKLVQAIADRQHCATVDDFYAALGYGGLFMSRILPFVRDEYARVNAAKQPEKIKVQEAPKTTKRAVGEGVAIEGIDNCLIKLSRCCAPIPGDEIIGFITRGHGVSVHKRDCSNVPKDITSCEEPERWVSARWLTDNSIQEFKAGLSILCESRVALMADVATVLADMRVMINAINTRELKDDKAYVYLTITVKSTDFLNIVISKLKKIDGVINVTRSSN